MLCPIAAGCNLVESNNIPEGRDVDAQPDADESSDVDEQVDVQPLCLFNEYVYMDGCNKCAPGTTRPAGDDPGAGEDTECDAVLCEQDHRVAQHTCVPCEEGTMRAAGDDASGEDTTCDPIPCAEHEFVSGNACKACPMGLGRAAGDDPAGEDTDCDIALCAENEHVSEGKCVPCATGETQPPGDNPNGADTTCLDMCFTLWGVSCQAFDQGYIKAINTGEEDQFGHFVDIHEDVMVVGAPFEDSDGSDPTPLINNRKSESGAAFVYHRIDGQWKYVAYLKAPNPHEGDVFGASVAVYDDVIVVGAPKDDFDITDSPERTLIDSGAAYVFRRTPGTNSWLFEQTLKAPNADADDRFGTSVDVHNGVIAVGAYLEDGSSASDMSSNDMQNSGALYMFEKQADTWTLTDYLKASNRNGQDTLGRSVALDDGWLVVSAIGEDSALAGINQNGSDNDLTNSGAIYVFTNSGVGWIQQAYIKPLTPVFNGAFGHALDIEGDRLIAGSYLDNTTESKSGAAYVFHRQNNIWTQQAKLTPGEDAFSDQRFGFSVALEEGFAVVGAPRDGRRFLVAEEEPEGPRELEGRVGLHQPNTDPSGRQDVDVPAFQKTRRGAVYVFKKSEDQWPRHALIRPANADDDDFFGWNISLHHGTLGVGAIGESSGGKDKGSSSAPDPDPTNNDAPSAGAVYVRQLAPLVE